MNYSTEESVGKGRKEWEISPADDRLSASHFLSAIQRMLSFSSTSKGPFSLFFMQYLIIFSFADPVFCARVSDG